MPADESDEQQTTAPAAEKPAKPAKPAEPEAAKPAAPAKPKGKWYEVDQPDAPMYVDESEGVDAPFAAYLVDPDGHPGTYLGVFAPSAQGTRPAQAVRLAISRLDGYDQAKAKAAEFVTVRVRYVRRTLAIATDAAATEGR
jgi:hypothetical protein